MIGAGLGPEKGLEALGISGDLEDKTGRRVVGTGLVELRPSVATTGVVPAGMVPAWALTEAQHSRRTSRSRRKARGPIAQPQAERPVAGWLGDRALPSNRGGWARGITGRVTRGLERRRDRGRGLGEAGGAWARRAKRGGDKGRGPVLLVNSPRGFQEDCSACFKNVDFQVPSQGILIQSKGRVQGAIFLTNAKPVHLGQHTHLTHN